MDDSTLFRISDPILKEKCILILGPNISVTDSGKSINELLKQTIESTLGEATIKNYFSDDEFFQFEDDNDENTALGLISDFFSTMEPSALQQKIAEIPFHLIISTSPDHLLVDLFKKKNYDYTYAYYSKKGENKDVEKPSSTKPLIYNLFGDMDNAESIVYTYDQLFEYLEAVFSRQDLPPTLKSILNNETNFLLFVGFRYEKWYFKLLLRLLKLYKIKSKYGSGKDPSIKVELIKNFYTEQFGVKFIDYDEMSIIDAIYDKFKNLGKLRGKSEVVISEKPPIYISYAWGGEREKIVDDLYQTLTEKAYNVIRDKQDLGYKGDIQKFMDLIGSGAYVIAVISDKYLKSKNCMYEMQSIYNNKDIQKRIFPIVLGDAGIYDPVTRADYNIYWQNEKAALQTKYDEIKDKSYTGELIRDLNNYDDFRRIIDEITKMLSNMNTLTPDMHTENNFLALMNALDQQMQADKK